MGTEGCLRTKKVAVGAYQSGSNTSVSTSNSAHSWLASVRRVFAGSNRASFVKVAASGCQTATPFVIASKCE